MFNRYLITICFFFCVISGLYATHNRAGEITYKRIPPYSEVVGGVNVPRYTYLITITKYTDHGTGKADRCVDTVYFGDGERGIAARINGPSVPCNCGKFNNVQVGCGEVIINTVVLADSFIVKLNTYTITHTYAGPGSYLIRSFDPNRNQGVDNIPNSVNIPFYVESLLIINGFSGANSSPVFDYTPIDRGCVNECFEHNPGAFDPDDDSLSYELTQSKGIGGKPVPLYSFPDPGPGGTYNINPRTGLLSWCNPQRTGEYNLAFVVKEWRKNTSGKYVLIGYVMRDMQVIIADCPLKDPPVIVVPPDTCVEAGTLITKTIWVSDPNAGDRVTVEGGGAPFSDVAPFASFSPTFAEGANLTKGVPVNFTWQTNCEHVRQQEYHATFKATDNSFPVKQVSFRTYIIKVVPPAIKNVTAVPFGSTIRVSWNAATCIPQANPVVSYRVYRKNGCSTFSLTPCQVGVSPTSGYALIKDTIATEFLDDNKGNGLVVGENYSYVVVARYLDGTETYASTAACAKLKRDVPILLNVDVQQTHAADGKIWVRWSRPLFTKDNLDTTMISGPYRFDVIHRSLNSTNTSTVFTTTANSILGLDTAFTHTNLNTTAGNEEYVIQFVAGTLTVGNSQRASSVFLKTVSADRRINLEWSSQTPWQNMEYTVLRAAPSSTTFETLGTTTGTTFTDENNLENGLIYCYKILAKGEYSDPQIFRPLLNNSQEVCTAPVDLTPPATPTLAVEADCPDGSVFVTWDMKDKTYPNDDVSQYSLYHKSTFTGEYLEVAFGSINKKEFNDLEEVSGCYAVQAIDVNGNRSGFSEDVCIDNCPAFELPNLFTPNGDDKNDEYKAIIVRQIKEINLVIVDRWGAAIYRTTDPFFRWNGVSALTNKLVDEGTYFYTCEVFEPRLKGIVKRTLRGYVHVAR
jgi:gliding motility-associated-like protein